MSKNIALATVKLAAKRKSRANARTGRAAKALKAVTKIESDQPSLVLDPSRSVTVAKEVKRLKATIAKLTAGGTGGKPKQLYFDEIRLAARWGMSVKHIRTLRYKGVGLKVTYFGRSVRYRLRDIVAYERSNTFASRSDMEVRKPRKN